MAEENTQTVVQETTPAPQSSPTPKQDTFSKEYVDSLRGNLKSTLEQAQSHEKALRSVLGLKDSEELGDVSARIQAHQNSIADKVNKAMEAANQRLIQAELKGLEGYNHKLLSRLIDLSGVKVDEQGNVTGLEDAVKAVAEEFPEVQETQGSRAPNVVRPGTNNAGEKADFSKMTYSEEMAYRAAHPYEKFD